MADASYSYTAETIAVLAASLIVGYGLLCLFRRRVGGRLPPGPTGLPVVGYLPFLTRNPHLKLIELRKKYGPVFSIQMGSHYVVVLCDFNSIRDAFTQDAFMGRPRAFVFQLREETYESEAMSGVKWKEQKRFSLQILKDLGFGRSKMEDHIKEEIQYILEHIEENSGKPLLMRPVLTPSMSNNISSLVFGRRMEYTDPKRIMLDGFIKTITQYAAQTAIYLFFPWMKTVMLWLRIGNLEKLNETDDKLDNFFRNEIKEHEETLDPENIRDYIDGYLLQIEKKKDDPNSTFIKPVLVDMLGAFFGAGSDTVRITVDWLLLVNAAFPDVQRRVQAEIHEVIGAERFPKYSDHTQMPYTDAVIMEVLRWRNLIPINFLRETLEDTEINSYFIAKGTYILGNQWAVQHDPALWGHPETFRPERFLSDDGKSIHKPEFFIPFSIGKRSCPGEQFAYTEVFLYFVTILQKFSISIPDGATLDMEGDFNLAVQPKQQELIFTRRR